MKYKTDCLALAREDSFEEKMFRIFEAERDRIRIRWSARISPHFSISIRASEYEVVLRLELRQ